MILNKIIQDVLRTTGTCDNDLYATKIIFISSVILALPEVSCGISSFTTGNEIVLQK